MSIACFLHLAGTAILSMVPVTHLATSMQGGGSTFKRQVSCPFLSVLQEGMDIKRVGDLPEVRANVYHVPTAERDSRSHSCALAVHQTLHSCIWLQCQLGDMVFLVCASESELCSLLASALH